MQSDNDDKLKPMKALYNTPQSLRALHPLRPAEPQDPLALYNGYGVFSIEKNIAALRTHPDPQRIVALKLISTNLNSPEQKLRSLKLGLIPELVSTTTSNNEKIFQLCCEVAQKLCSVNQARNMLLASESFINQLLVKFENLQTISESQLAAIKTINIMSVHSSLMGNMNLLITKNAIDHLVKNLNFLDFEIAPANISSSRKTFLLANLEALCFISSIPEAREECAECNVLSAVNKILKNDSLRQNNERMVEYTSQLIWNVCLEGIDIKEKATKEGLVQTLLLTLEHHKENAMLVRLIVGAINAIVVFEPAKMLTPYAMPLLCNLLHYYYAANGSDVTILTNKHRDDVVTNISICLKLCSEFPESRDKIFECFSTKSTTVNASEQQNRMYIEMIFPGRFNAFYPYCCEDADLKPVNQTNK